MVETPFSNVTAARPTASTISATCHPEDVITLIRIIEDAIGKHAIIEHSEGPAGDVKETYATSRAQLRFRLQTSTGLGEGIPRFVEWFRGYHA
jgi:UDP-glucuronate 4-epimerase